MNFPKSAKNITKKQRCPVHNGFLVEALLEVRELVDSGSEAMHIIDEALGKAGISPFLTRHPECSGLGTIHAIDEVCDHCRKCGGVETDPDGLCEICLKCSLCCDEDCDMFFINNPAR